MGALNPLAVEPKFRPLAFCSLIFMGLIVAGKVGFDCYSSFDEETVLSSRTEYGALPNIWLCSWTEPNTTGGSKVIPVSNTIKVTGSWVLNTPISKVTSGISHWNFTRLGGPAQNGECAFFQTSKIVNPQQDLFVKLEAKLVPSGGKTMRHIVMYAESPADAGNGQVAWQSDIGWSGAIQHVIPLLYTSMFKNIVGDQHVFSQEKHAEYTGAVRGMYDLDPDGTVGDEETLYLVKVWLNVIVTTAGAAGVMEHLKQSAGPKLIRLVAALGGVLSIVGGLFAICFVQRRPRAFQLTMWTPGYQAFSKKSWNSEDTRQEEHDTGAGLFDRGLCPPEEDSEEDAWYPQSAGYDQNQQRAGQYQQPAGYNQYR